MKTEFRAATESDLAAIMALLTGLYKGDVGPGIGPLVQEYIGSENHRVLVAQEQGEPLGVLLGSYRLDLDWECRAGLVDALVVSEAARGRGIGKRLVREFCGWARQRGCALVQVINPNPGFFGQLGFTSREIRFWQAAIEEVQT